MILDGSNSLGHARQCLCLNQRMKGKVAFVGNQRKIKENPKGVSGSKTLWKQSNVSYTVILLEIPQNRCWCKDRTPPCLLAESLET